MHYLRALFYYSNGKLKESFKDFFLIDSKDLFPKQLINYELWPSLNIMQKETIKEQEFYKNCLEYKRIEDEEQTKKFSHLCHQTNSLENINEDTEFSENLCKFLIVLS